MDNKYFIADYSTGTRMTNVGQNNFTVSNSNIQAATLSTATDGAHQHGILGSTPDDSNFSGGRPAGDGFFNDVSMVTNVDGAHSHNVTIGTASPNSIDNRPVSKKMYAFVYLGE